MAKGYTDFFGGMFTGAAKPTAPGGVKYMDWEKAEKICLEHPYSVVYAGLAEDWGWTSGKIYENGKWYDGGTLYDRSKWATPILDVDGEEIECFTHEEHERTGIPKWWGRGEEVHSEWEDYDE